MAKKTTAKKKVVKKESPSSSSDLKQVLKNKMESCCSSKCCGKKFHLIVFVLVAIAIAYVARRGLVAATVNGELISRLKIVQKLEKSPEADQLLRYTIQETLMLQEARKSGVEVSKEEVAAEISKIEEQVKVQNQTLDEILTEQKMTRKELEENIHTNLVIEKVMLQAIPEEEMTFTEEEIQTFIEENKDDFPPQATDEEKREMAEFQLQQPKMNERNQKIMDWIKNLEKNASVKYAVDYGKLETETE